MEAPQALRTLTDASASTTDLEVLQDCGIPKPPEALPEAAHGGSDMEVADTPPVTHPDEWAPGLRVGLKSLNTRTVNRAIDHADVLRVCLCHNLRSGNDEHRHRHGINDSLSHLNTVMHGARSPEDGVTRAMTMASATGAKLARHDALLAVEIVIKPPTGWDRIGFWREFMKWLETTYGAEAVLSVVVHRDQRQPHAHAIVMPILGGRWVGSVITTGSYGAPRVVQSLLKHMRQTLGIRQDRAPSKTFAEIMTTPVQGLGMKVGYEGRPEVNGYEGRGKNQPSYPVTFRNAYSAQTFMPTEADRALAEPLARALAHMVGEARRHGWVVPPEVLALLVAAGVPI